MLTDWFGEEREHTRKRLQLTAAADWWAAHGEDPSGLLSGLRLEEAKQYGDLTALERRFVDASGDAISSKQRKVWWASLGVLSAAIVLLAFVGVQTWRLWNATTTVTAAEAAARKAQSDAAEAQRQKDEIDRKTLEARTQFDTVLAEVAKAVHGRDQAKEELEGLNAQLEKARQDLQVSEAATAKAQTVVEQRTVELRAATQQLGERPWLKIADGTLDLPRQWNVLEKYNDQIYTNAASVARVQIVSAQGGFFHTGFLVGPDVLATFWVTSLGAPSSAKVVAEFSPLPGASEPLKVPSASLLAFDERTNIAVFRLASAIGLDRRRPLKISDTGEMSPGRAIYALGFGGTRGLGATPGYIVSMTDKDGFFNHDCQTTAGTSGAPIVDLASGVVIGIHWGATGNTAGGGPGIKRGVSSAVLASFVGRALRPAPNRE
jgi:hypothetical protein